MPVAALLVGIVVSCGALEADEMKCEEAAGHVEECCSKIDARRFNCLNQSPSSCAGQLVPAFTEKASECVRDKACADMVANGSCERILQIAVLPYQFQDPRQLEAESCR